jgi:hypothetical protein
VGEAQSNCATVLSRVLCLPLSKTRKLRFSDIHSPSCSFQQTVLSCFMFQEGMQIQPVSVHEICKTKIFLFRISFPQATSPLPLPRFSFSALLSVVQSVNYHLTLFLAWVIYFTLKMEATRSSETSALTRTTRSHIPEEGFLQKYPSLSEKYGKQTAKNYKYLRVYIYIYIYKTGLEKSRLQPKGIRRADYVTPFYLHWH